MKYRSKPVEVEAIQWFKMGDHEDVVECAPPWYMTWYAGENGRILLPNGDEVIVHPSDWVVTDTDSIHVVSDKKFREKYEALEDDYQKSLWWKDEAIFGTCQKCGEVLMIDHKCPEWVTK
jgi:hypothetical protein